MLIAQLERRSLILFDLDGTLVDSAADLYVGGLIVWKSRISISRGGSTSSVGLKRHEFIRGIRVIRSLK